ncbi:MAG TPA: 2-isopropylmalate synthase [Ktedonobacteraceae bacterium]|nr:2-isopropylmalate synthase [Ktedonobacteraceae bacterium]
MMAPRIVKFYETTLRDGEQTPGVNYFPEEKLKIAQALADMGFDTLDCGFPASSPGELEAVRLIASQVENAEICAIARAHADDIDCAWKAVNVAVKPVIQPFISVSPLHRKVKLGKTRDEVLEMARIAVARARTYTENVDFALEDTTRTEPDFILEVCEAILKEGVRFVTLCDTVGYALPWEFGALVARVKREFPSIRISAHCHDDLGMAVANALEGLRNGAERVDSCINGLGERAGNAATEEIVMAIRTRAVDLGIDVKIDTPKIRTTSRLVSELSGMQLQWNKAIVGKNVFSHAGGIHQDGVLKDVQTYEIMTPESVGFTSADRRVYVGKLSGRAALNAQMRELGYQLETEQLNKAFDMAKLFLGKKKTLEEMDMHYIAKQSML